MAANLCHRGLRPPCARQSRGPATVSAWELRTRHAVDALQRLAAVGAPTLLARQGLAHRAEPDGSASWQAQCCQLLWRRGTDVTGVAWATRSRAGKGTARSTKSGSSSIAEALQSPKLQGRSSRGWHCSGRFVVGRVERCGSSCQTHAEALWADSETSSSLSSELELACRTALRRLGHSRRSHR